MEKKFLITNLGKGEYGNLASRPVNKYNVEEISREETDPTVPEYIKLITQQQISNWDNPNVTSLEGYATEAWVNSKGYLTSLPAHTHNYENPLTFVGSGATSVSRSGDTITISSTDEVGTGADGNDYATSLSFSTSSGDLVLSGSGTPTLTKNLDGRYALLSHTHNYESPLTFVGSGATEVTRSGNTITISSTSGTGADGNNYLTGVSGSGNGAVTFTRSGLGDISWDSSHTHNYDNYGYWRLGANANYTNIGSNASVNFVGSGATSVSRSGNTITISSTAATGGEADGNNYPTSMSFSTSSGVLTINRNGMAAISEDLDGRYAYTSHTHNYEEPLTFVGSGATSVSRSGNTITISSTSGTGGEADGNNYVSSISFSTSSGVLTLGRSGLTSITEDLDGRYAILSSSNTFSGNITAPAFYESSLRKYKTNIVPFKGDALKLVNDLDIVTFDRKDKEIKGKIGVIADDTSKEFLSEDLDAVDLYKTTFIQAKAIQELTDRVERLETILELMMKDGKDNR